MEYIGFIFVLGVHSLVFVIVHKVSNNKNQQL